MLKYEKFLKDILSNKEKLAEVSSIPLSARCSVVLQSKLPEKMADPGSFTIPCVLGDDTVRHALADLGASINLMPYSVFSRPFLATAQNLIDVREGKLILRVGDDNVTFDILNREISEVEMVAMTAPPLMDDTVLPPLDSESSVEIVRDDPRDLPSVALSLELKDLPDHLEYAFLDEERKLPVIIVSALTEAEKVKLLKVLKAYKEAIAWKSIDIKGINPSFCTPKILMKDNFKSVVQPQRRLNPKMLERSENVEADHLSRLERAEIGDVGVIINDHFPIENLMFVKAQDDGYPWFADIANFLFDGSLPRRMSHQQKNNFFADVKFYIWDDSFLFRIGADQLVRRCVDVEVGWRILSHCHEGPTVGHHGAVLTAKKVFDT
ncbi:uncharacterized protein LOC143584058 [Bidens hawaiensis]|uniref:uncharacterized protein LOC143584058 n=1 Tax=Bidens hawaiensis TaxID=980011 RepID=UPI004049A88E